MRHPISLVCLIVCCSCSRTNLSTWDILASRHVYLPPPSTVDMQGTGISARFQDNQISCQYNDYLDADNRTLVIKGDNGSSSVEIDIKTDSLRLQTYQGCTGKVHKYPSTIQGFESVADFSVTITSNQYGKISGVFDGTYFDPNRGKQSVFGSLFDLEVYLN